MSRMVSHIAIFLLIYRGEAGVKVFINVKYPRLQGEQVFHTRTPAKRQWFVE